MDMKWVPLRVQEAFDAGKVMAEASRSTPLFFILFPGYSPSKDIEKFAASQDRTVKNGKLTLISMGQVTNPTACPSPVLPLYLLCSQHVVVFNPTAIPLQAFHLHYPGDGGT